jgi:hypothetical protein
MKKENDKKRKCDFVAAHSFSLGGVQVVYNNFYILNCDLLHTPGEFNRSRMKIDDRSFITQ